MASAPVPTAHPAVLFDLDDTLVPWQTPAHWQWAWRPMGPVLSERHVRAALKRTMHAWDRRRWQGLVGAEPVVDASAYRGYLARTLSEIAGHGLPVPETEAVVARFLKPMGDVERFDDVAPCLKRLEADGHRIGVLTDLPAESARHALHRIGLAEGILILHGDEGADFRPPAAAAFRTAAGRLGAKPKETVFVGDQFWSDFRAAHRAGLRAVLVDRSDQHGSVEALRIRSLAELPGSAVMTSDPSKLPAPELGP